MRAADCGRVHRLTTWQRAQLPVGSRGWHVPVPSRSLPQSWLLARPAGDSPRSHSSRASGTGNLNHSLTPCSLELALDTSVRPSQPIRLGARTGVVGSRQLRHGIGARPRRSRAWLLAACAGCGRVARRDHHRGPAGPQAAHSAGRRRGRSRRPWSMSPSAASAERPALDGEPEEEGEERRARRQAPTPALDGDAASAPEPQGPQDGVIVVGEPTAARDGIADMRQDARTPEDIAAFDVAAGRLQPLSVPDRARSRWPTGGTARAVPPGALLRQRRAHRQLRAVSGSRRSARIATNNVFREQRAHRRQALEVRGNVRAVSDWRAHAIEFRASGLASFYDEYPTEDDRSYALEARGRLDICQAHQHRGARLCTRSTRTGAASRDSPANAAERGDVETDRAAVALNHRFNRLGLQLRGSVTDIDFAPVAEHRRRPSSATTSATTRSARRPSGPAGRSTARVDVFAEVAVNDREFYAPPDDGILRSSTGERYRVGVAFGPRTQHYPRRGECGLGPAAPRDGRLGAIDGFIIDANLAWRATALDDVPADRPLRLHRYDDDRLGRRPVAPGRA